MNKEEIKGKIKEIIANYDGSDVSEINEQTKFADDLGLDSLDLVQVVMETEKEFIIQIPDDEAEQIQTVGDLVLLVERHNQK